MKRSTLLSRVTIALGLACVACCSVSLIGVGVLAAVSAAVVQCSELLAIALLAAGAFAFWIWRQFVVKRPKVCELEGACNPNKNIVD